MGGVAGDGDDMGVHNAALGRDGARGKSRFPTRAWV